MKLVWDQKEDSLYEFGVDRGVFYPSEGPGVVWNGLVKVDETKSGGESNSYHYDGVKYLDTIDPSNYVSTISAYWAPSQLKAALGEKSILPGFILTRQPREVFGLSYRTWVGPEDVGYKIHIVYNALASPTQQSETTMDKTGVAALLSWKIEAVPPIQPTYRPSAHYILDSMTMPEDVLAVLEDILYGSDMTQPRLPDPDELLNLSTLWAPYIIMGQSTTGLANLVPGVGDIYRTEHEGIHRALPQTRLKMTAINGIYRLE